MQAARLRIGAADLRKDFAECLKQVMCRKRHCSTLWKMVARLMGMGSADRIFPEGGCYDPVQPPPGRGLHSCSSAQTTKTPGGGYVRASNTSNWTCAEGFVGSAQEARAGQGLGVSAQGRRCARCKRQRLREVCEQPTGDCGSELQLRGCIERRTWGSWVNARRYSGKHFKAAALQASGAGQLLLRSHRYHRPGGRGGPQDIRVSCTADATCTAFRCGFS